MGLLSYKIQEDHSRILNPSCGLRGDQNVHYAGQMLPMLLDVSVSNVITPNVATKLGEPLTGVKAKSREVEKSMKYQEVCRSMGLSFLPVVFESQGLSVGHFLLHFDKLIARRAEEIGALIAPLKIY